MFCIVKLLLARERIVASPPFQAGKHLNEVWVEIGQGFAATEGGEGGGGINAGLPKPWNEKMPQIGFLLHKSF